MRIVRGLRARLFVSAGRPSGLLPDRLARWRHREADRPRRGYPAGGAQRALEPMLSARRSTYAQVAGWPGERLRARLSGRCEPDGAQAALGQAGRA